MLTLNQRLPAILALSDGSVFYGTSVGAIGHTVGEVVFNTAMSGYQEILTDPSYARQIITFTYPHIGNVGINPEDQESHKVWVAGLIVRDMSILASNWRMTQSLPDYLETYQVVGISDIDTRRLTLLLREKGSLSGCILSGNCDQEKALTLARTFPGMPGLNLIKDVSTSAPYPWTQRVWNSPTSNRPSNEKTEPHIVVYDFGVKFNILSFLKTYHCRVTVVPENTSAEEVLQLHPDGVVLSNGPGDPAACPEAIQTVQILLEKNIPLLGICLGHQLLALACGAKTIKMKVGHHGANHPVHHLKTGHIRISSQNHGFTVDEASLPACLEPTYRSLFDNTLQGFQHKEKIAMGFQGHPEGSPGPQDMKILFKEFLDQIVT